MITRWFRTNKALRDELAAVRIERDIWRSSANNAVIAQTAAHLEAARIQAELARTLTREGALKSRAQGMLAELVSQATQNMVLRISEDRKALRQLLVAFVLDHCANPDTSGCACWAHKFAIDLHKFIGALPIDTPTIKVAEFSI